MRPLFVQGMMGSGKTSVGREVAALAHAAFCDLDRRIERVFGETVAELFAVGEPRFRAAEHAALRSLVDEPGFAARTIVVATGGGTAIDPANRRLMRSCGVVVLLEVPLPVLADRLRHETDARPLIAGASLEQQLAELWRARADAYRDGSIAVDGSGTIAEVAARVHEAWQAGARAWTPG
ncbi:MAG TPA: shikimate kinase [Nannocystaceae bacterium]|nr:shikimate kinase [Nannocystaceae bacterium]